MMPAREALGRLQEGNRRFVAGVRRHHGGALAAKRPELVDGQAPFAAILGCSDSRVPVEIVFDQDLGDLFVVRVAGNIVAPSLVGSIEFAAERFGTRLVVVLGHSSCGAVVATLEQLRRPQEASPNISSITDRVRPAVEPVLAVDSGHDEVALVREAVRANVTASAAQLRSGSHVLERLIRDEGLLVVGAKYSLDSGVVDFFDGV